MSSSEHETISDIDENDVGNKVSPSKYNNVLTESEDLEQMETIENLPAPVRRRVNALKNLQLEVTNLEAKFFEEVHLLECKYNRLYFPIHEKRQHIVTGLHEPTDAEADWKLGQDVDEIAKDLETKAKIDEPCEKPNESKEKFVGIPLFWLTALKNAPMVDDMIQPHDEPILAHLIDIKTIILEADPMGFVLEFHFSSNEYFPNSVLTKEYEMKCIPDPVDPFSFEGPEIVKCKGCKIDWNKGKNVTVKQVKKKQKHKNKSAVTRTVMKSVPNDSFFNFFNPPEVPEDSDSEEYEDTQALLTTDFEIGHLIRERVVPNAVLYFTDEMIGDDYDDEEEEDEEEDEDDIDLEEEESDLEDSKETLPMKISKRKGRGTNAKSASGGANGQECKQQ